MVSIVSSWRNGGIFGNYYSRDISQGLKYMGEQFNKVQPTSYASRMALVTCNLECQTAVGVIARHIAFNQTK